MNRLLKSILQTGLDVLDESDRWTRPMRGHIRDTADMVRRRVRGEDHTLRSVLFFAAGVGVGACETQPSSSEAEAMMAKRMSEGARGGDEASARSRWLATHSASLFTPRIAGLVRSGEAIRATCVHAGAQS